LAAPPGSDPSYRAPGSAVELRDNVWAGYARDGQDRSHVTPMTMTIFRIRIVQLVLAVAYLVLTAFAAFTLNAAEVFRF
jgi:hypothetical protein